MKPVFYNDNDEHLYACPETGQVYISTTTFLGNYKPKKDWNLIASKYAKKNGQTKEHWIAVWKKNTEDACIKGSAYHAKKESEDLATEVHQINNRTFALGPDTGDVQDLYTLPDGVYLEILLWNEYFKLAGMADKITIWTEDGVRYVEIMDYKTSKEIIDYNYIDRNGNKVISEKMLAPLGKVTNCSYNVYQLQLNIYGWMLTQFGFKIRGGIIIHVKDVNDPLQDVLIPLVNMQREVELLMVDRYKSFKIS